MKGNRMQNLLSHGLPAIMGLACGLPALGDAGKPPADLSEYVYLHLTRGAGILHQDAVLESMCRGKVRTFRS